MGEHINHVANKWAIVHVQSEVYVPGENFFIILYF